MDIYIVDIKKRQKSSFDLAHIINKDSEVLSLTPYSCFLLDEKHITYMTYHDIISMEKFNKEVFKEYYQIEQIFENYPQYGFLFRDIAKVKNYEIYYNYLLNYIGEKKKNSYNIIYISDAKYESNIRKFHVNSNETSGLYYSSLIDTYINLESINQVFYKVKKINSFFNKIRFKDKILKTLFKLNRLSLFYDNEYIRDFWEGQHTKKINTSFTKREYEKFVEKFESTFLKTTNMFLLIQYQNLLNTCEKKIEESVNIQGLKPEPFSYLSNYKKCIENLLYQKNNIPRVFWQHGSYLHEHIFLKFNEIIPADINFVCNEYTKKLFLKDKDKNIYNVGSIFFNKMINEKNKIYDFVYIINNMHYSCSGAYIDSKNALYAMDGNNLYIQHKKVIELFGIKFKHKTICIKMQPGIFLGSMLYVPLLELSEKYKNITIEFSTPLLKVIEKSKYIISDYFSSEFINRELHYKRDIILFKGSPLPLPEETIEDMKKMFILVDTVDDLKDKIENIEELTKNRKRHDDIIEYYSSKKCDTKKVVTEILEKEFERR